MSENLCRGCRTALAIEVVYPGREPSRTRRCGHCHRPFPTVVIELELAPREIIAEHRARGLDGPVHLRAATVPG